MPSANSVKLSCESLWKVYGNTPEQYFTGEIGSFNVEEKFQQLTENGSIIACGDVKLDIPTGSIFIIMGLSGSGKSTVLRCLSRLVEPSFGKVELDGLDLLNQSPKDMIEIRRHKMGMVFQNFGLLPHLNVLENVAFPLKAQGISKNERLARANEMIDLVGLEGRENSYPHQLSGGQQQRVGIARSLAAEPEVWFLDEPFSALDPLIRTQMQDEFLRLQKQLNKTIVFVTHDFHEALRLADTICIMKDGQVVQIGTPGEIVLAPADDYVKKFTSEVPLWKIIEAQSIMEPPDGKDMDRPSVKPDTLLEEVMRLFDGKTEEVQIVNESGECHGVLTPVSIIRALYRDEKKVG
ncbi:MAG: betaine/proline/choline family ABC transporter ATP-binding protein [Rhodobacteraceae bacterium]|nr:betaine/proline/choline family ABC transporter ATP-binding protein [Paracoccaceae bacterium]MYI90753.1 betaine/proline/choline family ABC transporter ATP-binding protein [Paracoccaceae bacterium]